MMTSTTTVVIVFFLFASLGIWVFFILRMLRQGSRLIVTAALKRFASDFGLKFWTHLSPYHDELANLTGRPKAAIANVLRREMGDVEMVWFEVLTSGGKGPRYEPRVAIRKPGICFPKFALAKRSFTSRVALWAELKRILLGDQSFDARWSLFGDDTEAVRTLFNPSFREKIAGAEIPPSMIVRGSGDWLLFNVKAFRPLYGWPAIGLVTKDLRTFLSWMGKAAAIAGWFLPLEAETTSFMVPSGDGLRVHGGGRDKGNTLLILAALAVWLLTAIPSQVADGDSAVVATGILLAVALSATGAIISRLYKRALARTTDSLARGL